MKGFKLRDNKIKASSEQKNEQKKIKASHEFIRATDP